MKKYLFIVVALQSIQIVFAQTNIFPSSGDTGIGTTSPQGKLHIYQSLPDAPGLIIQGNTINVDAVQHYTALTFDGDYGNATGNYSQIRSYSNLYANWGSRLTFLTTASGVANTLVERLRIEANGNVGIGTSTPDAKLTVAGKIHSQEIKVTVNTGADFVFENDFKLRSLSETEQYIKENKHLPEMPSANEMKTDGLELGEMNIRLLQKVEELTLHLIEMDKKIKIIQEENMQLKVNK